MVVIAVLAPLVLESTNRDVRRAVLRRSADRMAPLVAAIERFEITTGRPPHELAELTHHFPLTPEDFGVRGCRSLRYSVAPDVAWRWELSLDCPNGVFALDRFFFRPSQEYATTDPQVERIGDWAYRWD
jgi:hypothetical protein